MWCRCSCSCWQTGASTTPVRRRRLLQGRLYRLLVQLRHPSRCWSFPRPFTPTSACPPRPDIIGFIGTLAFIWLGILVFFEPLVTHDYSLGKNFVTILGTLIAMVFIMFIAVLFTTLIGKIVSLITNIVTEIQYRM